MNNDDQGRGLSWLAVKIEREHNIAVAALDEGLARLRRGLEHKVAVGKLLAEAKAIVGSSPRGAWRKWVEENLPFKPRMARKYLAAARHGGHLKRHASATLDLDEVAALLADPPDTDLDDEGEATLDGEGETADDTKDEAKDKTEDETKDETKAVVEDDVVDEGAEDGLAAGSAVADAAPLPPDHPLVKEAHRAAAGVLRLRWLTLLNPIQTARAAPDPQLLRDAVEPLYNMLRLMLNELNQRLAAAGKIQAAAQPLTFLPPGMLNPAPPDQERIEDGDPIAVTGTRDVGP